MFSEFSERFGIQPAPEQIRPTQDTEQTLDQLPVEILQVTFYIFNQSFILISFILYYLFFSLIPLYCTWLTSRFSVSLLVFNAYSSYIFTFLTHDIEQLRWFS